MEIRRRISGFVETGQVWVRDLQPGAADTSIKPVQDSIEGLAQHAVSVHVQQAGSVNLVMTTCCSVLADVPVVSVVQQDEGVTPLRPSIVTNGNEIVQAVFLQDIAATGFLPLAMACVRR